MKPEMTAEAAVELLQLLEKVGIEVWLDMRDMELLQARFGVELPVQLRRQS